MTVHGQHAAPRFRFRVWPRPAAEVPAQDAPDEDVAYDTSYDDPGWDGELHDAASPGFPLPAPDDTMVWRVPGLDGGPGMVIPPATLETPEEPLPARVPGAAIPAALVPVLRTEPAHPDMLRDLRDTLEALPCDPEPREAPSAYLRAVVPGGETGVTQIQDAIGRSPLFAGSGTVADGRTVAGMYLGTNDDGWFVLDALSAEWCEDAITALTAMRDALVAARDGDTEDEAAA